MSTEEPRPESSSATPTPTLSPKIAAAIGLIVGALLGSLITIGVVSIAGENDSVSDNTASSASSSNDVGAAPAEEDSEEPSYTPTTDDFSVELTVKDRKCYGSAGCNVTYRVKPDYKALETPIGKWEITYQVSGIEDGPQIETFTLQDEQFSFQPEISAQTTGPNARVKAKVTDVVEGY